jgi:hypothetical protein
VVIAKKLSPTALSNLARRASFIFRGRVRSVGKHNLDGVVAEDRMALVRVVEVIVAPPTVGDLTGKTITVYLESTRDVNVSDEATFFATSWHYGKNIGVTEIGRTSTPAAELRERVLDERLEAFNANLEARIRRASLIVSGHVLTTARTDDQDLPGMDEGIEWWEADIFVASVEKGKPPRGLHIYYPVGGDREWGPVPKCYPGQVGVWLLGPVTEPDADERTTKRRGRRSPRTSDDEKLMAIDPVDYQAISALPLVQELLRRTGER